MTETTAPKRLGRPPKFAGEKTRGSVTIRMRDKVRKELEESAQRHGRSLSEEIETRMEISLAAKHQLQYEWGEDMFELAAATARALSLIEDLTGKSWLEDGRPAVLLQNVFSQIVRNYLDRREGKVRDVKLGALDEMSTEELVDALAVLSGVAPPRKRRAPVEIIVTDD